MSAKTMREQFEAWECDADQGPQTDPVWLMHDATTNTYPLDKIQSRWEVWQASREAIEVELPEERVARGYGNQVADALGFNDAVGYCRKAIESLGLKVKA